MARASGEAWEALGAEDVPFTLDDRSNGWLAVADADQLDQVLWALLDNAVKYGARRRSASTWRCRPAPDDDRRPGQGIAETDRVRMFGAVRRRGEGPRKAAASASMSRASCVGRWAATGPRAAPGRGGARRSASTCRASHPRTAEHGGGGAVLTRKWCFGCSAARSGAKKRSRRVDSPWDGDVYSSHEPPGTHTMQPPIGGTRPSARACDRW